MPSDSLAAENGETSAANRGEPHDGERRRRRRGRRGGRRNRLEREREGLPGSQDRDTDEASREPDMHESSRERDMHKSSRERDMHEQPPAFASAEELTVSPESEQGLTRAVADLDAAPMDARPSAEPADLATARESPPPAQPEPPRRRSTVREPAPAVTASEAPQPPPTQPAPPAPEPVITEVGESESTERPRRSGWWSRRIAGG